MGTKLILCSLFVFIFGGCLHAAPHPILPGFELDNNLGTEHDEPIAITSPVPTTTQFSNKRLNIERELQKITEACIFPEEYEETYGVAFQLMIIFPVVNSAHKESSKEIGLTELRKVLKFSPLPPRNNTNFNLVMRLPELPFQGPVITLEDYYNTQEPRNQNEISVANMYLLDKNVKTTIDFLDKRFPSIRKIYKQEFERLAPAPNALDKKAINEMISSYKAINSRIEKALDGIKSSYECALKRASELALNQDPKVSAAAFAEYQQRMTMTTTPPPPSELEEKIFKIAGGCLKENDSENTTNQRASNYFSSDNSIPREHLTMMGLQELRDVLKFSPLPAWTNYNGTLPSDKELDSAPTLEAYYNLQEPKSKERSLDNGYSDEPTFVGMVKSLDESFPEIRSIYRSEMVKVRMSMPPVLNKETIDTMLNDFVIIDYRVYEAVSKLKEMYNKEC